MNVPVRTTSIPAIVSLIFGIICWMALPFVGAIVAIVLGHIARSEIRRSPPGTLEGDGMALAGLILGYLHIVLVVAVLALVLSLSPLHLLWH